MSETKKVAALYARVSTGSQTARAQLDTLRAYAIARGWSVIEFVDEGWSGTKARRPALDAMMDAATRRAVDVVCVVRLDRLARSVHHLVTMAGEFARLGVDLAVIEQAIDTGSSAGRLMFGVLASIAQFEADLAKERTAAGVAAARRRGVKFGRPEKCDRAMRERVLRLVKAGRSVREVAALVGVSKSLVAKVAKASRDEVAA